MVTILALKTVPENSEIRTFTNDRSLKFVYQSGCAVQLSPGACQNARPNRASGGGGGAPDSLQLGRQPSPVPAAAVQ